MTILDRLKRYWPTVKERLPYTGPLSTFAEYHAVGVGFVLGPEYAHLVVAYGLTVGGGKTLKSGHMRDAFKELGYVAIGVALRMLAGYALL